MVHTKEINIAATLAEKRREKGITQDELAEYIGVSKASVSKWETGQSYPDITFLPQLAAYFNISIDELMRYTPQMTKENIRKQYHRLSVQFADASFEEALAECRAMIKKYYACFPLLFQMAVLLINHHMLVESEDEKEAILREAAGLCVRIKTESDDVWLAKDAAHMQAVCHMLLREPQEILHLLGENIRPYITEEVLISQAYQLMGNSRQAREIIQIGLYQRLMSLLEVLINFLTLCAAEDPEKADEAMRRAMSVADAFHMDALSPNISLNLYTMGAQLYCARSQNEKALEMLERCADICIHGFFPYMPHGDSFFDLIDDWLSDIGLGTVAPRSEKFIKESMLQDIILHPAFSALAEEPRYQNVVQRLKRFVGGHA